MDRTQNSPTPKTTSTLATQADEALRRVIADRRPQSAPKPPPAGTPARTAFMRRMGW